MFCSGIQLESRYRQFIEEMEDVVDCSKENVLMLDDLSTPKVQFAMWM